MLAHVKLGTESIRFFLTAQPT